MRFKCNVCGNFQTINKKIKQGFCQIAYDTILELSDFTSIKKLPSLNNKYWVRCNTTPHKDEMKIAKVFFPFDFNIGDSFNILYQPPMSYFNGWKEYPDEIEQSAIVNCSFDRIIDYDENSGRIWVKILDVIPIGRMTDRFSETIEEKRFNYFDDIAKVNCFKYKNWVLYDWDGQGDIGEWALFDKDNHGREHLILFCEWGFHSSNIYCGNIIFKNSF